MSYYGDEGMVVSRNRCKLDVYFKENTTIYDKDFTILCTHANDEEVFVEIKITQEAEVFSVTPSETEIELSSIVQKNINEETDVILNKEGSNIYFEYKEIGITVVGGSKRYRIVDISRFHITGYDEENNPITTRYKFNNGFILKKNNDNIVIKSYGRPFLDGNDYFVIRIQHYDTRDVETSITVRYAQIPNRRRTRKVKQEIEKIPQISKIYMPLNKFETLEEKLVMKEPMIYKIEFEDEVDNYTIYNKVPKTELLFNVTLNGEPCDLKSNASSTGTWCKTEINEYYDNRNEIVRKLIIKINDYPITERNSRIKVYLLDKPEVFKLITLTNKPS